MQSKSSEIETKILYLVEVSFHKPELPKIFTKADFGLDSADHDF